MYSNASYPTQVTVPFIGATKSAAGVFTLSPVTLTAINTDNTAQLDVSGMQQIILLVKYTTGSGETNNVLNMTVQFSPDGTNYYQEAVESPSSGTVTEYQATRQFTGAAAATAYTFRPAIPLADVQKIKILFHETGVASNFGTVSVLATISGQ